MFDFDSEIGNNEEYLETLPLHQQIEIIKREILEAQKKGDTMRAAELRMKLQQKLQEYQANIQMMSNIQSMMHQTTMGIINNIK